MSEESLSPLWPSDSSRSLLYIATHQATRTKLYPVTSPKSATLDRLDEGHAPFPRSAAPPSSLPPAPPPHDYLRSPARLSSPHRGARPSQPNDDGSSFAHPPNNRPLASQYAGSPFLQGSPADSSTSSFPSTSAPEVALGRLQHTMGTERERYAGGEEQMAAQEGRRSSALPAIPLKEGAPMGGQSSGRTRQWLTRRADDHPLEPSHSPEPSLVHPSSDRTARHSTQSSSSTPHHSSALASPLQASSRQSSSRGVSTHESHAYSSGQHLPPSSYDALTPSQRIAHESQTERAPDPSARSGNFFGIGGLPSGAGHHSRREDDRVPPPPSKSSPRRDPPPTSSSRRPPAPPATPPPKRSFFGLGGKIPSPKPPSSNSKPSPSTLQKPRAPPTSHGRSSSGGEIGRTLSSTPVRSSATAAYRTSQSVGRTTTRPDRDAEDWVVLDPPERAPLPPPHQRLSESPQRSQEPYNHGFRTPLRRARELSTEFASPPFFATSPPTSDSHGSYEGGADLLGMGSLGDARDWRWKEILEGYQGPRGGTPVHSREGTEESGRAEVVARPARRSSLLPVQTGVERMEYAMSPPGEFSLAR